MVKPVFGNATNRTIGAKSHRNSNPVQTNTETDSLFDGEKFAKACDTIFKDEERKKDPRYADVMKKVVKRSLNDF